MATHLVKEGYPVTGFDVFPQARQRFNDAGGKTTTSLADSAKGKSFYVCMVASAPQLDALLFEGTEPLIEGTTEPWIHASLYRRILSDFFSSS